MAVQAERNEAGQYIVSDNANVQLLLGQDTKIGVFTMASGATAKDGIYGDMEITATANIRIENTTVGTLVQDILKTNKASGIRNESGIRVRYEGDNVTLLDKKQDGSKVTVNTLDGPTEATVHQRTDANGISAIEFRFTGGRTVTIDSINKGTITGLKADRMVLTAQGLFYVGLGTANNYDNTPSDQTGKAFDISSLEGLKTERIDTLDVHTVSGSNIAMAVQAERNEAGQYIVSDNANVQLLLGQDTKIGVFTMSSGATAKDGIYGEHVITANADIRIENITVGKLLRTLLENKNVSWTHDVIKTSPNAENISLIVRTSSSGDINIITVDASGHETVVSAEQAAGLAGKSWNAKIGNHEAVVFLRVEDGNMRVMVNWTVSDKQRVDIVRKAEGGQDEKLMSLSSRTILTQLVLEGHFRAMFLLSEDIAENGFVLRANEANYFSLEDGNLQLAFGLLWEQSRPAIENSDEFRQRIQRYEFETSELGAYEIKNGIASTTPTPHYYHLYLALADARLDTSSIRLTGELDSTGRWEVSIVRQAIIDYTAKLSQDTSGGRLTPEMAKFLASTYRLRFQGMHVLDRVVIKALNVGEINPDKESRRYDASTPESEVFDHGYMMVADMRSEDLDGPMARVNDIFTKAFADGYITDQDIFKLAGYLDGGQEGLLSADSTNLVDTLRPEYEALEASYEENTWAIQRAWFNPWRLSMSDYAKKMAEQSPEEYSSWTVLAGAQDSFSETAASTASNASRRKRQEERNLENLNRSTESMLRSFGNTSYWGNVDPSKITVEATVTEEVAQLYLEDTSALQRSALNPWQVSLSDHMDTLENQYPEQYGTWLTDFVAQGEIASANIQGKIKRAEQTRDNAIALGNMSWIDAVASASPGETLTYEYSVGAVRDSRAPASQAKENIALSVAVTGTASPDAFIFSSLFNGYATISSDYEYNGQAGHLTRLSMQLTGRPDMTVALNPGYDNLMAHHRDYVNSAISSETGQDAETFNVQSTWITTYSTSSTESIGNITFAGQSLGNDTEWINATVDSSGQTLSHRHVADGKLLSMSETVTDFAGQKLGRFAFENRNGEFVCTSGHEFARIHVSAAGAVDVTFTSRILSVFRDPVYYMFEVDLLNAGVTTIDHSSKMQLTIQRAGAVVACAIHNFVVLVAQIASFGQAGRLFDSMRFSGVDGMYKINKGAYGIFLKAAEIGIDIALILATMGCWKGVVVIKNIVMGAIKLATLVPRLVLSFAVKALASIAWVGRIIKSAKLSMAVLSAGIVLRATAFAKGVAAAYKSVVSAWRGTRFASWISAKHMTLAALNKAHLAGTLGWGGRAKQIGLTTLLYAPQRAFSLAIAMPITMDAGGKIVGGLLNVLGFTEDHVARMHHGFWKTALGMIHQMGSGSFVSGIIQQVSTWQSLRFIAIFTAISGIMQAISMWIGKGISHATKISSNTINQAAVSTTQTFTWAFAMSAIRGVSGGVGMLLVGLARLSVWATIKATALAYKYISKAVVFAKAHLARVVSHISDKFGKEFLAALSRSLGSVWEEGFFEELMAPILFKGWAGDEWSEVLVEFLDVFTGSGAQHIKLNQKTLALLTAHKSLSQVASILNSDLTIDQALAILNDRLQAQGQATLNRQQFVDSIRGQVRIALQNLAAIMQNLSTDISSAGAGASQIQAVSALSAVANDLAQIQKQLGDTSSDSSGRNIFNTFTEYSAARALVGSILSDIQAISTNVKITLQSSMVAEASAKLIAPQIVKLGISSADIQLMLDHVVSSAPNNLSTQILLSDVLSAVKAAENAAQQAEDQSESDRARLSRITTQDIEEMLSDVETANLNTLLSNETMQDNIITLLGLLHSDVMRKDQGLRDRAQIALTKIAEGLTSQIVKGAVRADTALNMAGQLFLMARIFAATNNNEMQQQAQDLVTGIKGFLAGLSSAIDAEQSNSAGSIQSMYQALSMAIAALSMAADATANYEAINKKSLAEAEKESAKAIAKLHGRIQANIEHAKTQGARKAQDSDIDAYVSIIVSSAKDIATLSESAAKDAEASLLETANALSVILDNAEGTLSRTESERIEAVSMRVNSIFDAVSELSGRKSAHDSIQKEVQQVYEALSDTLKDMLEDISAKSNTGMPLEQTQALSERLNTLSQTVLSDISAKSRSRGAIKSAKLARQAAGELVHAVQDRLKRAGSAENLTTEQIAQVASIEKNLSEAIDSLGLSAMEDMQKDNESLEHEKVIVALTDMAGYCNQILNAISDRLSKEGISESERTALISAMADIQKSMDTIRKTLEGADGTIQSNTIEAILGSEHAELVRGLVEALSGQETDANLKIAELVSQLYAIYQDMVESQHLTDSQVRDRLKGAISAMFNSHSRSVDARHLDSITDALLNELSAMKRDSTGAEIDASIVKAVTNALDDSAVKYASDQISNMLNTISATADALTDQQAVLLKALRLALEVDSTSLKTDKMSDAQDGLIRELIKSMSPGASVDNLEGAELINRLFAVYQELVEQNKISGSAKAEFLQIITGMLDSSNGRHLDAEARNQLTEALLSELAAIVASDSTSQEAKIAITRQVESVIRTINPDYREHEKLNEAKNLLARDVFESARISANQQGEVTDSVIEQFMLAMNINPMLSADVLEYIMHIRINGIRGSPEAILRKMAAKAQMVENSRAKAALLASLQSMLAVMDLNANGYTDLEILSAIAQHDMLKAEAMLQSRKAYSDIGKQAISEIVSSLTRKRADLTKDAVNYIRKWKKQFVQSIRHDNTLPYIDRANKILRDISHTGEIFENQSTKFNEQINALRLNGDTASADALSKQFEAMRELIENTRTGVEGLEKTIEDNKERLVKAEADLADKAKALETLQQQDQSGLDRNKKKQLSENIDKAIEAKKSVQERINRIKAEIDNNLKLIESFNSIEAEAREVLARRAKAKLLSMDANGKVRDKEKALAFALAMSEYLAGISDSRADLWKWAKWRIQEGFILGLWEGKYAVAGMGMGKTFAFAVELCAESLVYGNEFNGMLMLESADAVEKYLNPKAKGIDESPYTLVRSFGLELVSGDRLMNNMNNTTSIDNTSAERGKFVKALKDPRKIVVISREARGHLQNKIAHAENTELLQAVSSVNVLRIDEFDKVLKVRDTFIEGSIFGDKANKVDKDVVESITLLYDILTQGITEQGYKTKGGELIKITLCESSNNGRDQFENNKSGEGEDAMLIYYDKYEDQAYVSSALQDKLESLGFTPRQIQSVLRAINHNLDRDFTVVNNKIVPVGEGRAKFSSVFQDINYLIAVALKLSKQTDKFKGMDPSKLSYDTTNMQSTLREIFSMNPDAHVAGGSGTYKEIVAILPVVTGLQIDYARIRTVSFEECKFRLLEAVGLKEQLNLPRPAVHGVEHVLVKYDTAEQLIENISSGVILSLIERGGAILHAPVGSMNLIKKRVNELLDADTVFKFISNNTNNAELQKELDAIKQKLGVETISLDALQNNKELLNEIKTYITNDNTEIRANQTRNINTIAESAQHGHIVFINEGGLVGLDYTGNVDIHIAADMLSEDLLMQGIYRVKRDSKNTAMRVVYVSTQTVQEMIDLANKYRNIVGNILEADLSDSKARDLLKRLDDGDFKDVSSLAKESDFIDAAQLAFKVIGAIQVSLSNVFILNDVASGYLIESLKDLLLAFPVGQNRSTKEGNIIYSAFKELINHKQQSERASLTMLEEAQTAEALINEIFASNARLAQAELGKVLESLEKIRIKTENTKKAIKMVKDVMEQFNGFALAESMQEGPTSYVEVDRKSKTGYRDLYLASIGFIDYILPQKAGDRNIPFSQAVLASQEASSRHRQDTLHEQAAESTGQQAADAPATLTIDEARKVLESAQAQQQGAQSTDAQAQAEAEAAAQQEIDAFIQFLEANHLIRDGRLTHQGMVLLDAAYKIRTMYAYLPPEEKHALSLLLDAKDDSAISIIKALANRAGNISYLADFNEQGLLEIAREVAWIAREFQGFKLEHSDIATIVSYTQGLSPLAAHDDSMLKYARQVIQQRLLTLNRNKQIRHDLFKPGNQENKAKLNRIIDGFSNVETRLALKSIFIPEFAKRVDNMRLVKLDTYTPSPEQLYEAVSAHMVYEQQADEIRDKVTKKHQTAIEEIQARIKEAKVEDNRKRIEEELKNARRQRDDEMRKLLEEAYNDNDMLKALVEDYIAKWQIATGISIAQEAREKFQNQIDAINSKYTSSQDAGKKTAALDAVNKKVDDEILRITTGLLRIAEANAKKSSEGLLLSWDSAYHLVKDLYSDKMTERDTRIFRAFSNAASEGIKLDISKDEKTGEIIFTYDPPESDDKETQETQAFIHAGTVDAVAMMREAVKKNPALKKILDAILETAYHGSTDEPVVARRVNHNDIGSIADKTGRLMTDGRVTIELSNQWVTTMMKLMSIDTSTGKRATKYLIFETLIHELSHTTDVSDTFKHAFEELRNQLLIDFYLLRILDGAPDLREDVNTLIRKAKPVIGETGLAKHIRDYTEKVKNAEGRLERKLIEDPERIIENILDSLIKQKTDSGEVSLAKEFKFIKSLKESYPALYKNIVDSFKAEMSSDSPAADAPTKLKDTLVAMMLKPNVVLAFYGFLEMDKIEDAQAIKDASDKFEEMVKGHSKATAVYQRAMKENSNDSELALSMAGEVLEPLRAQLVKQSVLREEDSSAQLFIKVNKMIQDISKAWRTKEGIKQQLVRDGFLSKDNVDDESAVEVAMQKAMQDIQDKVETTRRDMLLKLAAEEGQEASQEIISSDAASPIEVSRVDLTAEHMPSAKLLNEIAEMNSSIQFSSDAGEPMRFSVWNRPLVDTLQSNGAYIATVRDKETGKLLGYIAGCDTGREEIGDWLNIVAVDPAYQRKSGMGRLLMLEALNIAKQRQQKLSLGAQADVLDFYARFNSFLEQELPEAKFEDKGQMPQQVKDTTHRVLTYDVSDVDEAQLRIRYEEAYQRVSNKLNESRSSSAGIELTPELEEAISLLNDRGIDILNSIIAYNNAPEGEELTAQAKALKQSLGIDKDEASLQKMNKDLKALAANIADLRANISDSQRAALTERLLSLTHNIKEPSDVPSERTIIETLTAIPLDLATKTIEGIAEAVFGTLTSMFAPKKTALTTQTATLTADTSDTITALVIEAQKHSDRLPAAENQTRTRGHLYSFESYNVSDALAAFIGSLPKDVQEYVNVSVGGDNSEDVARAKEAFRKYNVDITTTDSRVSRATVVYTNTAFRNKAERSIEAENKRFVEVLSPERTSAAQIIFAIFSNTLKAFVLGNYSSLEAFAKGIGVSSDSLQELFVNAESANTIRIEPIDKENAELVNKLVEQNA